MNCHKLIFGETVLVKVTLAQLLINKWSKLAVDFFKVETNNQHKD